MDGDPAGPQPPWRSPKAYRIPDWVEPVVSGPSGHDIDAVRPVVRLLCERS